MVTQYVNTQMYLHTFDINNENIHAYVIGNCNLNFVIVIGKSITSLNIVSLYLLAVFIFS